MFKKFTAFILVSVMFFSMSAMASAAAYISPANQTIYGSSATASWTLSWSGGKTPWVISFDADNGNGYRVINTSTTFTTMNHQQMYKSNTSAENYTPRLRVMDQTGAISGVASASVAQRLR